MYFPKLCISFIFLLTNINIGLARPTYFLIYLHGLGNRAKAEDYSESIMPNENSSQLVGKTLEEANEMIRDGHIYHNGKFLILYTTY